MHFQEAGGTLKILLLVLLKDEPTLSIDLDNVLARFSFATSMPSRMVLAMPDPWRREKMSCSSENDLKLENSIKSLESVTKSCRATHALLAPDQSHSPLVALST